MKLEYQIGNKKIARDTMIINMGPAKTCPSKKLGLCQVPAGKCYALKAEKMYPACLPYRRRQAMYWRRNSAGRILEDIKTALKRHKKVKYIRFNESGDIKDYSDIVKLFIVARGIPEYKVYTYTARRDLKFPARPDNLVIAGSGFMLDNNFKAVKKYTPGAIRCPGHCGNCNLCKNAKGITIENLYH